MKRDSTAKTSKKPKTLPVSKEPKVFETAFQKRLEPILMENNLRIFTEFKDAEFQGKQYRPDMVIAYVDMESDADYWR